jgi:hypothetical protein
MIKSEITSTKLETNSNFLKYQIQKVFNFNI